MNRKFLVHENPDAAYIRQLEELELVREDFGDDNYKELLRELLKSDLWFLSQFALAVTELDSWLHGQLFMEHYAHAVYGNAGEGQDLLTIVPRTHIKTLFSSAFHIQSILNNSDIAIAIMSGTEALASKKANYISNALCNNEVLQFAFSDILPSKANPTNRWGMRGYYLPNRKNRTDPTLVFGSAKSNVTGTHPDILEYDDIVYGDKESELEEAETAFIKTLGIATSNTVLLINGTRWKDGDLYGKIFDGTYTGLKGEFKVLFKNCWKDKEQTEPLYPKMKRNGSSVFSGFTREELERRKKNQPKFFACQFMNDPKIDDKQEMSWSKVKIYEEDELPRYSPALCVGVEIKGTSITFPSIWRQTCKEHGLAVPLFEVKPHNHDAKLDRILVSMGPIIQDERFFIRQWMADEGLREEVERFGVARHDDILDAIHFVPLFMTGGMFPDEMKPSACYVSADLAFSTESYSDYSVFAAVVIDCRGRHYLADLKRFKEANAITIATELIKFFQRVNSKAIRNVYNNKKKGWNIGRSYN